MTLPLVWKVYFIKTLQPQFYCWHSQISLLGCKFHFSSIIGECSTGGLSLGASFACFSVSWNSGLVLCFWEWWTGRDHFLVLVSVWGTTSSCISLLVNPGKSSKISKLITHSLQRFQQLCFLPARMRWGGVDAGPGWIHPFWWEESHSAWSQSEHQSTIGHHCDPLSTAPHVPRAHMGCTCTCHCPHVKNLQDNLQALGKIWSLPHLQGLNKEWPLV